MPTILSRRATLAFCLSLVVLSALPALAADDVVKAKREIEPFNLSQVRLLPSPFKSAQDKNSEYLLSVEPDRLIARFRENVGLEPRAKNYGGWEAQSIAGHSLGHYLSAIAKSYASTGDERFKERAEYVASELAECQEAAGSGILAGDPNYFKVFEEVARGDIRTQGFDLNGLWVPWYALHKLFEGLLDAYHYCDSEQALDVAKRLGDWTIDVTKNLTFEQMQKMLLCEYGGMNDALYSLYAATGDEKYLKAGDRFYDNVILKPLSEGRDELQHRHANTQIPKLAGLARRFEIAGNGDVNAFPTAEFFWNRVTEFHTYAIGGNSNGEHFGPPGVLSTRFSDSSCETCNTYNMLKLTQRLYMQSGEIKYLNYFERALYNHILSSIDKSDDLERLYTYFIPLTPGGFRTYSTRETHWTCCHGTGMENHTQYNGEIYYHMTSEDGTDVLLINLLIPSTLDWTEKGVVVSVDASGALSIDAKDDMDLDVKVRVPNNCYVDQNAVNVEDGYYNLGTEWTKGQTIKQLPICAEWTLEPTPDNPNVAAFFRGPILYAGDVGPIDAPIATQLDVESNVAAQNASVIPVVISDSRDPSELVDDAAKDKKRSFFETPEQAILTSTKPNDVALVPFYATKERYCVYFNFFTEATWAEKEKEFVAERERRARLEKATLQFFQPGEMQPERDHNFKGEKSLNGIHMGRKWRDARDGGFFEFDMKVDQEKACALVITYWGDDSGYRFFDILIDGQKIAEKRLDRDKPGKFFEECYSIPNPDGKSTVRVRFQGKPGAMAGGIFGARTIFEEARDDFLKNN